MQTVERAFGPTRRSIEDEIERLITMLDMTDPDPDLEDGFDREEDNEHEPSLCGMGQYFNGGLEYDLEQDNSDNEPDLGWTEEIDQVRRREVASGWQVQDGEPWLGWCDNTGMGVRKNEPADDREWDVCDVPHEDFGRLPWA